jgi:hypothetical protein
MGFFLVEVFVGMGEQELCSSKSHDVRYAQGVLRARGLIGLFLIIQRLLDYRRGGFSKNVFKSMIKSPLK